MPVNFIIQNILGESPLPVGGRFHIEECSNKGKAELIQDLLPLPPPSCLRKVIIIQGGLSKFPKVT